MKKNKSIIFKIFLFVTILTILSVLPVCAAEKTITLTFADFNLPSGLAGRAVTILQEEIAEKTNGRVNLKIYPGESLLKGPEILKGVEEGVVDMGCLNPPYYPNQLPISGVFGVILEGPAKYESQLMIYKNVEEQIPEWKAEVLAHNQIPLFFMLGSDRAIYCTKPLTSLEDFKNKKMRTSARWMLEMLKAAGATPVQLAWSDVYMALQMGTIDAVSTNLDALHGAKMDEVARNILLVKRLWGKSPMFATINLNTWNKLPEDIQSQIIEATESAYVRHSLEYAVAWDTCIEEVKEMGCVVNSMSTEDMEKWLSMPIVGEMQAQWAKEAEDQGMENASKIVEKVKSIVAEVVEKEGMDN